MWTKIEEKLPSLELQWGNIDSHSRRSKDILIKCRTESDEIIHTVGFYSQNAVTGITYWWIAESDEDSCDDLGYEVLSWHEIPEDTNEYY